MANFSPWWQRERKRERERETDAETFAHFICVQPKLLSRDFLPSEIPMRVRWFWELSSTSQCLNRNESGGLGYICSVFSSLCEDKAETLWSTQSRLLSIPAIFYSRFSMDRRGKKVNLITFRDRHRITGHFGDVFQHVLRLRCGFFSFPHQRSIVIYADASA